MGLRASEIQNNAWDYHPMEDLDGPIEDLQEVTNILKLFSYCSSMQVDYRSSSLGRRDEVAF